MSEQIVFPSLSRVPSGETSLCVHEMSEALEARRLLLERIVADTQTIQGMESGTSDQVEAQSRRKDAVTKLQIVTHKATQCFGSWVKEPDIVSLSSSFPLEDKIREWTLGWRPILIQNKVQDYGPASDALDVSEPGITQQLERLSEQWSSLGEELISDNFGSLLEEFTALNRETLLLAYSIAEMAPGVKKKRAAEIQDLAEYVVSDGDDESEPGTKLPKRKRRCAPPAGADNPDDDEECHLASKCRGRRNFVHDSDED